MRFKLVLAAFAVASGFAVAVFMTALTSVAAAAVYDGPTVAYDSALSDGLGGDSGLLATDAELDAEEALSATLLNRRLPLRPSTDLVAPNTTAGSIRNVNPTGSGTNCVNCVVATDATLAGRLASALPSGPQPISALQDVFGGTFKPVAGQAEIAALMTDAGAGARGVVFGSRGSDVGHVFDAVNQGGTVRFLDGQMGAAASFSGFDGFQFMLIPG